MRLLTRGASIRGVPTVMLFKDGKVIAQKVGLPRKSELVALIDSKLDAQAARSVSTPLRIGAGLDARRTESIRVRLLSAIKNREALCSIDYFDYPSLSACCSRGPRRRRRNASIC